ncbi:MAG: DEAD/DEAH box helicase [Spirochaetaceae bacterium]|jgi:superfamily II DNA or RNA helicase|nr:DEAD/DEAH box helicase [Spirochaetaceae bacterium]
MNNSQTAWVIDCTDEGVVLRTANHKAAEEDLDYRKYSGVLRTVVREFMTLYQTRRKNVLFSARQGLGIMDPPSALVRLAAEAYALYDADGNVVRQKEGVYRCALTINDTGGAGHLVETGRLVDVRQRADARNLAAKYCLVNDENAVETENFFLLSPSLALSGGFLYETEYMGSDALRFQFNGTTVVKKADLPVFLSLTLSKIPNLAVLYEDWTLEKAHAVRALPALVFMEIDKYNYLHIRPLNYLRAFPPEFLENECVVTAVELCAEEKVIRVSEIVFADSPSDMFREMLYKGRSKETKTKIYEEKGRFILEPAFAAHFIGDKILDLSERFILLETQVLASYKIRTGKPRVRISAGLGTDFLVGKADVEFAGSRFSFASFMDEYKRSACVTLVDGSKGIPDKKTMDRLERLISRLKGEEVQVSRFDLAFLEQDEAVLVEGAAWAEARKFFVNYHSISGMKPDLTIANGKLRPYQEEGVRWLSYLGQYDMGGCLADEMGLGKTVQIISLLKNVFQQVSDGKVLILCTKSLVYNWAAELERFAPELPYVVHYGQNRDTVHLKQDGFSIVITSYITVQRDFDALAEVEFLYLILDEAQAIKNISTRTTMSVVRLKARHRIAISGTPIENNLLDLYSLFRFLLPGFFGSREHFLNKYLTPIQVNGDEDARLDLKRRIEPFVLRRLKRAVLKDLPPKSEETVYIDLDEEHLRYYHQKRIELKEMFFKLLKEQEFKKSSLIIFKALTALRQIATVPESSGVIEKMSAKRQYLQEKVVELCENGHKCIIFTNFLASVRFISADLAVHEIGNVTMTGDTSDRQTLVRRFQTDSAVKAFVMTLKTGGAGLNLTAADYIFIMDPWWNAAAESQAIDRAHRIGQTNPVFCYKLIARDTIEERMLQLQVRKQVLVASILSDDAGSLRKFKAEDINFLLGGDDV